MKENVKFCTYKTTYIGTLLPPHYIGSSTVSKVKAGYNGSIASVQYGSIYKQEQRAHKSLFSTEIISLHETREEAFDKELELHRLYDVVESDDYMNLSMAYPYFSNYGKPHSEQHKKKISEAQIGKKRGPMTEEHKKKNSESKKGILKTEEHKNNISAGKKGKPRPEPTSEARKNMSEAQKNRPARSTETGQRISAAKKGKLCAEETKKKISDTLKNRTIKTIRNNND